MIIAVDGPAGSGKSTVSKEVAKRLGITFLDSGALYRTCAYISIKLNLSGKALTEKITLTDMFFGSDGKLYVTIEGETEEVSGKIRTPQIAEQVSKTASDPEIRKLVTDKLRKMSETQSVIMDGRDIGTHVFPNADYKFFLKATSLERAKRRMKDYEAQGITMNIDALVKEIEERDRQDSEREHAPLKKAEDAFEIDTTHLTIEEVITIITAKANK